jgi:phosphoribosylamine--glycine ligase
MKVLVVGGGGREHTIVEKLSQSPKITKLYCAPGNGGIASLAECVPISAGDVAGMCAFAKEKAIDFAVVAPDDPLVLGMVDEMEKLGIRTFGPGKKAAVIEGSKVFSKELMKKYHIPTAGYEVFDDKDKALSYLLEQNRYPAVIKAEGLALGKGVIIAQNFEEAKAAVLDMMENKIFGESGSRVVIEEFLTGPEVSVLAFTDGKTMSPMVSAQDHKRAYDHDQGPNTGGMGTFSPSRVYTKEIADRCMNEIFLPTMEAMNKEGRTFKGCLYFGLMLTKDGPKVIEYNARFGDPETQVVLPRLKTDLFEIFLAISEGRLSDISIEWEDCAAVCIVLASGGYPKKYQTGYTIEGLEQALKLPDTKIYHAGTKIGADGKLITGGGRVLGVVRTGETLDAAIQKAYEAVGLIQFKDMHYRKDIGIK